MGPAMPRPSPCHRRRLPRTPAFSTARTAGAGRLLARILAFLPARAAPVSRALGAMLVAAATLAGPAAAAIAGRAASPTGTGAATGESATSSGDRVLDVTLVPANAPGRAASAPSTAAEAERRQPAAAGAAPTTTRPAALRSHGSRWPAVTALLGVVAAGAGWLSWRRRPRRCTTCGAPMRRLDAAAAFAELDIGERTDQLVGDVRYTVWRCGACSAIEKLGAARDLSAAAAAAPVGSAMFLRRRAQSGLSIWSPAPIPIVPPAPAPAGLAAPPGSAAPAGSAAPLGSAALPGSASAPGPIHAAVAPAGHAPPPAPPPGGAAG